jgi:hypothetical protein
MTSTKEKAEELVNSYRIILMNEDTECGNEILCTSIAKQCAIITVDEIFNNNNLFCTYFKNDYWLQVKQEIEKL